MSHLSGRTESDFFFQFSQKNSSNHGCAVHVSTWGVHSNLVFYFKIASLKWNVQDKSSVLWIVNIEAEAKKQVSQYTWQFLIYIVQTQPLK